MATVENIVDSAFWMAGILSPPVQTASVAQTTLAVAELNDIVSQKRRLPWFNVQLQEVAVAATTPFIYIGETVTSTDTDVTVVNEPFFSVILSATARQNISRYVLNIFPYSQLDNVNWAQTAGFPEAIFYANFLDDSNNFYTKIGSLPINTIYTYHFTGIAGLADFTSESDLLLNGMSQYLKYELSKRLAAIYNALDEWISKNESTRLKIENEFKSQSSLSITPTNTSRLSTRSSSTTATFNWL